MFHTWIMVPFHNSLQLLYFSSCNPPIFPSASFLKVCNFPQSWDATSLYFRTTPLAPEQWSWSLNNSCDWEKKKLDPNYWLDFHGVEITWTLDFDHETAALTEINERQNKWLSRWQHLHFANLIRSRDKLILGYKSCYVHIAYQVRDQNIKSHDCITMIIIVLQPAQSWPRRRQLTTQSCCTPESR